MLRINSEQIAEAGKGNEPAFQIDVARLRKPIQPKFRAHARALQ